MLAALRRSLRELWVHVKAWALGWHRVDETKLFVSSFTVAKKELLAVRQVRLDVFRAMQRGAPVSMVRAGEAVSLVVENANAFDVSVAVALIVDVVPRGSQCVVVPERSVWVEAYLAAVVSIVPEVSGRVRSVVVVVPRFSKGKGRFLWVRLRKAKKSL